MGPRPSISVIGGSDVPASVKRLAFEVGNAVANSGATLVCGGLGGVMEAAAKGARDAGGHTVGILPGYERRAANRHIEFAVATGMGEARNTIVVASGDAIIALTGEAGTLSEIGLALKLGRPVIALGAWENIAGLHRAETAAEAATLAVRLGIKTRRGSRR